MKYYKVMNQALNPDTLKYYGPIFELGILETNLELNSKEFLDMFFNGLVKVYLPESEEYKKYETISETVVFR